MGGRIRVRQRTASRAARRQHAVGRAARLLGWRRSQARHQVQPAVRQPSTRLPERRDLAQRVDGADERPRTNQRLRQPFPDDLGREDADASVPEGDTAGDGRAVGARNAGGTDLRPRRPARRSRPSSDGAVAASPMALRPTLPGRTERRPRGRNRRRVAGTPRANAVTAGDVAGADGFANPDRRAAHRRGDGVDSARHRIRPACVRQCRRRCKAGAGSSWLTSTGR